MTVQPMFNMYRIKNAVEAVYELTDDRYNSEAEVRFEYVYISELSGECTYTITIARSVKRDDLTYKLYTKHDDKPLMTIFGCWPREFVADVFNRALQHFYGD